MLIQKKRANSWFNALLLSHSIFRYNVQPEKIPSPKLTTYRSNHSLIFFTITRNSTSNTPTKLCRRSSGMKNLISDVTPQGVSKLLKLGWLPIRFACCVFEVNRIRIPLSSLKQQTWLIPATLLRPFRSVSVMQLTFFLKCSSVAMATLSYRKTGR